MTAKIDFGYAQIENYAGPEKIAEDYGKQYSLLQNLSLHHWGLQGEWIVGQERIVNSAANAAISLHFNAQRIEVQILLNNKLINTIPVSTEHSYKIAAFAKPTEGILKLMVKSPGLQLYNFTFG